MRVFSKVSMESHVPESVEFINGVMAGISVVLGLSGDFAIWVLKKHGVRWAH